MSGLTEPRSVWGIGRHGNQAFGRGMVNGLRLPEEWRERIEDLRDGRAQPPVPRHAATVVLMRDHAEHGLQVFMLRRVSSMAFAPGAYVFPGGSVDARDGEHATGRAGPAPEQWGAPVQCDPRLAPRLCGARAA